MTHFAYSNLRQEFWSFDQSETSDLLLPDWSCWKVCVQFSGIHSQNTSYSFANEINFHQARKCAAAVSHC